MARLPTRESLGDAPSARSGRQLATFDANAISAPGRAMAKVGQTIAGVVSDIGTQRDAIDEYETERKFQEFKYNTELGLEKSMQEIEPGKAGGFPDSWAEGYKNSAKEFLAAVPDRLKPKYDDRLFDAERTFYRGAAGFARNEQKRSSIAGLDDFKNKFLPVGGNLERFDRFSSDFQKQIDDNPFLTPVEKDELRRKKLSEVEKTYVESLRDREKVTQEELDQLNKLIGFGPELDTDENPELRAQPFSGKQEQSAAPDGEGRRSAAVLFSPKVNNAITEAANKHGVDPNLLMTFARIESGGRPGVQTGSYKGLFQLSSAEFRKHGGEGDIFDPGSNADAAAAKLKTEAAEFEQKYGRAPKPIDLYLIHQQGEGGYEAHISNPDRAAWESMASTAEGREKGARWAKQAIWGNIPDDVKKRFPDGVESVTSGDFIQLWQEKVDRLGGEGGEVRLAQAEGPKSDAYNGPFKHLTTEDRLELSRSIRSKMRSSLEGQREQLKQQLRDDVRSIRETGVGTKPDLATAKAVLEPNQINSYAIDRVEAEMEYRAINDLAFLPEHELESRLSDDKERGGIAPKQGEEYYEIKAKILDKAQKRADEVRDLRENNPAASVADFPEVKQATLALREDPENPEAIQNLARTRVDAQAKVGIPEGLRTPITKAEARVLAAPLRGLDDNALTVAVKDMIEKAEQQYGPYARAAAASAIDLAITRDKELATFITDIISGTMKGMAPKAFDLRRVERLAETSRAERAFQQMGRGQIDASEPGSEGFGFEPFGMTPGQMAAPKLPPKAAIEYLLQNPATADQFDARFGAGSAQQYLGNTE